jgi:hypothetical protein
MELVNEIKRRLEPALRLAKPPTLEEVLKQVSTRGVLRGPVDWVFPGWMLYVEYATQEIIKTFQLTEEERRALLNFRDTMKQLLLEAQRQAKAKLTSIYRAIMEDTYRLEDNRLYAPDGTWVYIREGSTPHILIRGVSALARFPDVLKLPRERLELLQLGWRASDEGETGGRPDMVTTQPWQVFAWSAMRYGEFYIRVDLANLTLDGVSVHISIKAKSWKQRWSKDEAIDLVVSHLKRGEWAPLFAAWLGDGRAEQGDVLHGSYRIVIVAKEPWRLGNSMGAREALVASGREAFERLREAAGVYGELLDLLRAHKWVSIKLATDVSFRAAYKSKRKRTIDVLRETYGNNSEISTDPQAGRQRRRRQRRGSMQRSGAVVVAGIVMSLYLKGGRGGTLMARCYVRDVGKALAIAERLESAELRPNIVRVGNYYMTYINMSDLLKLAEQDGEIRRAIALYLVEKAENGTPRQKEIAKKILKRYPFFLSLPSKSLYVDQRRAWPIYGTDERNQSTRRRQHPKPGGSSTYF